MFTICCTHWSGSIVHAKRCLCSNVTLHLQSWWNNVMACGTENTDCVSQPNLTGKTSWNKLKVFFHVWETVQYAHSDFAVKQHSQCCCRSATAIDYASTYWVAACTHWDKCLMLYRCLSCLSRMWRRRVMSPCSSTWPKTRRVPLPGLWWAPPRSCRSEALLKLHFTYCARTLWCEQTLHYPASNFLALGPADHIWGVLVQSYKSARQ